MAAFEHHGIKYSDDAFHQQGPPNYQVRNGLTEAVVKFRGPAPKASIFAARLRTKNFPTITDFGAPIVRENYTGYDTDDHPTWTTFTLHFDIGTALTEPTYKDSYPLQTVSIPITYQRTIESELFITNMSLLIQFRALATSWSWYETTRPGQSPRYQSLNSSKSPWDKNNIKYVSATNSDLSTAIDPANLFARVKGRGVVVNVDSYDVDMLIPGRLWKCDSTVIRTIDPNQASLTINA